MVSMSLTRAGNGASASDNRSSVRCKDELEGQQTRRGRTQSEFGAAVATIAQVTAGFVLDEF
jgi:hypothetical protein